MVTSAPLEVVQASLAARLSDDWAANSSGATLVRSEHPFRVEYRHLSGRNTGFTAVLTYQHLGPEQLRAVTSIEAWQQVPGQRDSARPDTVAAFLDVVVSAFRAVDPLVQVSR